jgi:hypothetical protein
MENGTLLPNRTSRPSYSPRVDRVERCRTPPPRDHHGEEEEEEEEEEGARMETAADAMEREEVGGGQDGADDRARIEGKDLRNIVVLRVSQGGVVDYLPMRGGSFGVGCLHSSMEQAGRAGGGPARPGDSLFFHPSLGRRQTNI